jgi:hypothetical protein
MTTGLERRVCEGPLCAGIRTHLASQFHPSGVCYACATHKEHPPGAIPKPSKDWMKEDKQAAAEKRADGCADGGHKEAQKPGTPKTPEAAENKGAGENKDQEERAMEKKCRRCGEMKPISDFRMRGPGDMGVPSKDGRIGLCVSCEQERKGEKAAAAKKDVASKRPPASPATSTRRPASAKANGQETIHLPGREVGNPIDAMFQAVEKMHYTASQQAVMKHSNRLLTIALLGPREDDRDFVRALCAGILEDTMAEMGVPSLTDVAKADAQPQE